MVVRIVTDSGADLPQDIAKELDITVVPLHVLFGKKDYRDGVDMPVDEFYQRLIKGPVHPTTSTASPGEFADVFRRLAQAGADGIISIHISEKLSKTYGSAVDAKEMLAQEKACPIEVIDSKIVTLGMGLLVMKAARLARKGKGFDEIVGSIKEDIPKMHLLGVLETLKYLIKGGRAPRIGVVSDILKLKTFLKIKDGELYAAGRTRSPRDKLSRLIDFTKNFNQVVEVAVEYSTNQAEVETVGEEIKKALPGIPVYFGRLGPVLGVHSGPGTLVVSLKTKE